MLDSQGGWGMTRNRMVFIVQKYLSYPWKLSDIHRIESNRILYLKMFGFILFFHLLTWLTSSWGKAFQIRKKPNYTSFLSDNSGVIWDNEQYMGSKYRESRLKKKVRKKVEGVWETFTMKHYLLSARNRLPLKGL